MTVERWSLGLGEICLTYTTQNFCCTHEISKENKLTVRNTWRKDPQPHWYPWAYHQVLYQSPTDNSSRSWGYSKCKQIRKTVHTCWSTNSLVLLFTWISKHELITGKLTLILENNYLVIIHASFCMVTLIVHNLYKNYSTQERRNWVCLQKAQTYHWFVLCLSIVNSDEQAIISSSIWSGEIQTVLQQRRNVELYMYEKCLRWKEINLNLKNAYFGN